MPWLRILGVVCLLHACKGNVPETFPRVVDDYQGLILVQDATYETMRKQCESIARADLVHPSNVRIQLIKTGSETWAVRYQGPMNGFHRLVCALRFTSSGIPSIRNYKAWWFPDDSRMLVPDDVWGCVLMVDREGDTYRFPVFTENASQKGIHPVKYTEPHLNPDSLRRWVCTTFD
jgi:hypothetical protein